MAQREFLLEFSIKIDDINKHASHAQVADEDEMSCEKCASYDEHLMAGTRLCTIVNKVKTGALKDKKSLYSALMHAEKLINCVL